VADARKSLNQLHAEWISCTACDLGKRRKAVEGEFVRGEGMRGGIMFVGEGPGKDEEAFGRPFIGKSGAVLRKVLDKLQFTEHYMTNLVACRSCAPAADAGGQPIFRKDFKTKQMLPLLRDEPPLPLQVEACQQRLHEEIYIVDPVLIVAVGATAAKTLIGKSVSITDPDVRGQPFHITIPGAGFTTVRTDKRGVWARKAGGKLVMPVEPSEVRYLCIPTIHPAYVLRKLGDQSSDSPFMQFAKDIQKAVQVYERYMLELHGIVPSGVAEMAMEFQPEDSYDDEAEGATA